MSNRSRAAEKTAVPNSGSGAARTRSDKAPPRAAGPPWLASSAGFEGIHPDDLRLLEERTAVVWVPRGTVLLRVGDPADALYVVVFGRFFVIPEGGGQPIAEIGPGEPIGELAFFAGVGRTATVVAARDSKIICLSRDAYAEVTRQAPSIASTILTAVAKRLARVTHSLPAMRPKPPRTIAILPIGSDSRLPRNLVADLADAIAPARAVAVSYDDLREVRMAADPETITCRLLELEDSADVVLFALDRSRSLFTDACLGLAEHLLLVAPASDKGMAPTAFEAEAAALFLPSHRTLAVVRDKASEPIRSTGAWLAGRDIALHHHLASDRFDDFERLGRFLTGSAVGLVLSGGAALGCAHIGIARALDEAGIPVDFIGGTSVGAAMGAALAMGLAFDEILDLTEEMFLNNRAMRRLTIPLYSLIDHQVLDALLQRNYRGLDIEDLPHNFFAVSASLTTNCAHIHRRGSTWEAVRASSAIPGILPPFITESGEVLVDGAIIDNVPVSAMRELKGGPNIVVRLRRSAPWRIEGGYGAFPGRGQVLRDLLLHRGRHRYPSLATVVVRGMQMQSEYRFEHRADAGDLVVVPAGMEEVGFFDWHKARQMEQAAYRQTADMLERLDGLDGLMQAAS